MQISIIIPAYNEAQNIGALVQYLRQSSSADKVVEIMVIDGGSTDETVQIAGANGAKAIVSPQKGRAAQMNYGASLAKGDVLYFLHADTFPPAHFAEDIFRAVSEGYSLGRYKTRFLSNKPLLRFNEWFTRFDLFICMGGDQTLFITRSLFEECGGFNNEMQIMEEYEFCRRAREKGRYKILNGSALISARKYDKNSWLRVQWANYTVVNMYKKGAPQQKMVQQYRKMLRF